MIDLEHCTILGNESIDANSLNRCMFNIHRKMIEASERTVGSESENVPSFPFFSGGYENALVDIDYVSSIANSADVENEGVVARLYSGDLNINVSQDNKSFSTESETGTYFYSTEQISTFAPSVSSLFGQSSPLIFRSILVDDESSMTTGTSSLGIASSPIVKFTSYLTCSRSGVSFGTITFKRNNGDHQENIITLNIPRDLIGIDGIDSIDFFSIGNGFSSGVKTISENLNMVSEIGQCTVTYLSDNDIAISNITKSDNSDYIKIDKETGRIVENAENDFGRYVEIPNDEFILNFFIMFTLKENVLKYTDDLWCFYIVNDETYGLNVMNDATSWARDYFRYSFDNFLAADDGKVLDNGSKVPTYAPGCTLKADDAFNGCYNATFKSLCWISPRLRYAERMFKGCTNATFDSLPNILYFDGMRSAVSMFENCAEASFGGLESIYIPFSTRLASMFSGCSKATFDRLSTITVGGDVSKMFYGDYSSDFLSLTAISGNGSRFISMFEGCDNASFPVLEHICSEYENGIYANRMFYGLEVPSFENIRTIELSPNDNSVGYYGVSMFEGCLNATFENLTSLGNVVDGTRMFCGCDPYPILPYGENKSTFENLSSIGNKLVYGNSMFQDNYFLSMTIKEEPSNLSDGTSMFKNTSSVKFDTSIPNLVTAQDMFSLTVSAIVEGNMPNLVHGESMFSFDGNAEVHGDMPNLSNAHNMFTGSDTVYVKSFPGRVENAINSFSDISGSCRIDTWDSANEYRIADNCFSNSNNVWIGGNIIAGKIVSTSHMFDSSKNITIYNSAMANAASEEERERLRFFSTESGENFVYLQRLSSDETSGYFTVIGLSSFSDISSYIASSYSEVDDYISTSEIAESFESSEFPVETESLVIASTLKTNSLSSMIYSIGNDSIWHTEEFSFDNPIEFDVFDTVTTEFSADYYYYPVSGYSYINEGSVVELNDSGWLAIRKNDINFESHPATAYFLYNTSTQTPDNRLFIISDETDYQSVEKYKNYKYAEIILNTTSTSSVVESGYAAFNGSTFYITINDETVKSIDVPPGDIEFDFIQIPYTLGYASYPRLEIGANYVQGGEDKTNKYAIISTVSLNGQCTEYVDSFYVELGKSDYSKLMIANSTDNINVRIIPVHKYGESETYANLMQYINKTYGDNRISFHYCGDDTRIPNDMYRCPKGYIGDYTVAQIFGNHDLEDDAPFGKSEYGTSTLESSSTTRFRTRFSIGNADMGGYWKNADSMFYNVVEDSLLSGYFSFSDISLEDTRDMFALDEYVENDQTFNDAGPLMQNLGKSNVSKMDGMFRNRCVVNPKIFKDFYNDETENYISFQIPVSAESASAAFFNCHISSFAGYEKITNIGNSWPTYDVYTKDGNEYEIVDDKTSPPDEGTTYYRSVSYDEICLYFPSTLTMADDMFNGYQGPNIRFGYDAPDSIVYIADNFSGERMFNGCLFTNTTSDRFGFDVPTIYINMFDGSNFEMKNVSSLNIRNGFNFAKPYSDDVFFYNDTKLLGCSSVSFDSLETDILDWFCTETNAVEGVYLATVIGPKNRYDETKNPPSVTADYRIMTADRTNEKWNNPIMSNIEQFTDEMISEIYSSTNKLSMNMMKEFENKIGRATCMFNPSIMFKYSYNRLGDTLSSNTVHEYYDIIYDELTNDSYIGTTYNQMEFGLVGKLDMVEMPFAFAGLSSATFDSLSSIGNSIIMGYGSFMNCTAATFDKLTTISFAQTGANQPENLSSRFYGSGEDGDWYGNYCNMFAGCSSASMSSLESILFNSWYSIYGAEGNNRVLTWFDVNGDINYMTYSSFSSKFTFSFDATLSSNTFNILVSDSNRNEFFRYDTEITVSEISSIDVRFKRGNIDNNNVLSIVEINKTNSENPFRFYIDTEGNSTNTLYFATNIQIWPYYDVYTKIGDDYYEIVDKNTQPDISTTYYRLVEDEFVEIEIEPEWPDIDVYVKNGDDYDIVDKSEPPEVGITYYLKSKFVDNYTIELSGDEYNENCNKSYFVTDTMTSNGLIPTDNQKKYDISEKSKQLILYRSDSGFHSVDVDENYKIDINYRLTFVEASGSYWIDIYDNNSIDQITRISSNQLSGVNIDDRCKFNLEMSEIDNELVPLIKIIDANNSEHIYEIFTDGNVEKLAQHPKTGVVKELYKLPNTLRFAEKNPTTQELIFTNIEYSDLYGQYYYVECSSEDSENITPGENSFYNWYVMKLTSNNGDVALLSTPITASVSPEDVEFSIGTYLSNGLDCVIVGISDTIHGDSVFYKIYRDSYFDEYGKSYKYVEQTSYNPANSYSYKSLFSVDFGKNTAVSNKAYCSGMFMREPYATFKKLDTISIPAIGSCAGMFSDVFGHYTSQDDSKLLSSIKYMVLPRTDKKYDENGFIDYRGILSGVPVSSVDFSNLDITRTNIYSLGNNGIETRGYELFYGMLGNYDLMPFDNEFNPMTKEIAVEIMHLDSEIADRMEWGNGLLTLVLDVENAGEVFTIAVQPINGNSIVTIDWGDGNGDATKRTVLDELSENTLTKVEGHVYTSPGRYIVKISDTISRFVVGDYPSYDTDTLKANLGNKTDALVTEVISFGRNITDASFAFAACESLRKSRDWNCEYVRNVAYCYYDCREMISPISKWTDYIEHCEYCYYNCESVNRKLFSDDIYELMPLRIVSFENCVYGANNDIRRSFFAGWGGTAEDLNSTFVVIHVENG